MRTLTASCSLLLAGLLLAGCGNSDKVSEVDPKMMIDTNFDDLQGWVNNATGSLNNKVAHSGRNSITVGAGKEYSLTFTSPLGQLIAAKPRKLHLEAWVRTEEANTPAQLVVQVAKADSDEKLFWKGIPLAEGSKIGQWTEVKADLALPDGISSDNVLSVYMWGNNSGKTVYLDDLRLTNAE